MKQSLIAVILAAMLLGAACNNPTPTPTTDPLQECLEECDGFYDECIKQRAKDCAILIIDCDNWEEKDQEYCREEADKVCEYRQQECDANFLKNCKSQCRDSYSSGRPIGPEEDCPPGTSPDPLGRCVTAMTPGENPVDTNPDDGCPPGTTPGPEDDCIPELFKVIVVRGSAEEWFVVCPPWTRPGPIDACVPDLPEAEGENGGPDEHRRCPPGTTPSPDDGGCVPVFEAMGAGNLFSVGMLEGFLGEGELDPERLAELEPMLDHAGVLVTHDVSGAIERTLESLGAAPAPVE